MPYLDMDSKAGTKRKRPAATRTKPSKVGKAESSSDDEEQNLEDEILELEAQVLESRKHYNNIPKLLLLARQRQGTFITTDTTLPAIALCRIFCRLYATGALKKSKEDGGSEDVIGKWLRERFHEYAALLANSVCNGSPDVQSLAMKLDMRLVKEQVNHDGHAQWQTGVFPNLVSGLLLCDDADERAEFCTLYFNDHDDVRVFTLQHITEELKKEGTEQLAEAALEILGQLGDPNNNDGEIKLFAEAAAKDVQHMLSSKKQRKAVQAAWLAVLKSPLSKPQHKAILTILVDKIVPWFNKVELLMDYLTDSYNVGGATSLLALSGLFHLMQERNLDYPSFYEKLYSLLDDDLLHSKHRSRFFRLLDVFMGSTHLPAALVASFIKRLSRLALHAPPAGIVVVVPWMYNMFKSHPQCTFMIHRTQYPTPSDSDTEGFQDPFKPHERDPMETNAIDSSIWEIHTLQNHWHPNVATLAKIISEQFTKQNYNLEDFLDHSYNTLVEAEVGKEMKKTPVVGWEIPKRVFLTEDGERSNEFGALMSRVLASADA